MSRHEPRLWLWFTGGGVIGLALAVPAVVPTSIEFYVGYLIFLVVLTIVLWAVAAYFATRAVEQHLPTIKRIFQKLTED